MEYCSQRIWSTLRLNISNILNISSNFPSSYINEFMVVNQALIISCFRLLWLLNYVLVRPQSIYTTCTASILFILFFGFVFRQWISDSMFVYNLLAYFVLGLMGNKRINNLWLATWTQRNEEPTKPTQNKIIQNVYTQWSKIILVNRRKITLIIKWNVMKRKWRIVFSQVVGFYRPLEIWCHFFTSSEPSFD